MKLWEAMAQRTMLHSDVTKGGYCSQGSRFHFLRDGCDNDWKEGTGRNSWGGGPWPADRPHGLERHVIRKEKEGENRGVIHKSLPPKRILATIAGATKQPSQLSSSFSQLSMIFYSSLQSNAQRKPATGGGWGGG
jgi:hypothetical protein